LILGKNARNTTGDVTWKRTPCSQNVSKTMYYSNNVPNVRTISIIHQTLIE
jgi:hypothetical protein